MLSKEKCVLLAIEQLFESLAIITRLEADDLTNCGMSFPKFAKMGYILPHRFIVKVFSFFYLIMKK